MDPTPQHKARYTESVRRKKMVTILELIDTRKDFVNQTLIAQHCEQQLVNEAS